MAYFCFLDSSRFDESLQVKSRHDELSFWICYHNEKIESTRPLNARKAYGCSQKHTNKITGSMCIFFSSFSFFFVFCSGGLCRQCFQFFFQFFCRSSKMQWGEQVCIFRLTFSRTFLRTLLRTEVFVFSVFQLFLFFCFFASSIFGLFFLGSIFSFKVACRP